MRLMVGGDIGKIIEQEAERRGIGGGTLARIILGDWVRDDYKKRMKKTKKPQEQGLGASRSIVEERSSDKAPQAQEE